MKVVFVSIFSHYKFFRRWKGEVNGDDSSTSSLKAHIFIKDIRDIYVIAEWKSDKNERANHICVLYLKRRGKLHTLHCWYNVKRTQLPQIYSNLYWEFIHSSLLHSSESEWGKVQSSQQTWKETRRQHKNQVLSVRSSIISPYNAKPQNYGIPTEPSRMSRCTII